LELIDQAAADGGLSAAVLDINLEGEVVSPVADRLAALSVPFVFATGYGENYNRGPHAAAPILTKPFNGNVVADVVRDLTAGDTPRRAVARDASRPGRSTSAPGTSAFQGRR